MATQTMERNQSRTSPARSAAQRETSVFGNYSHEQTARGPGWFSEIATGAVIGAEVLGQQDAAELLEETLDEEKETDENLTVIAGNIMAGGDEDEDEEEKEEA